MVTYASGSIRFSGLGSDYDFDSMVKKLAAIESRQVNQFMQWQQDWQKRLEAIKSLRGELMNMQTTLKKMNSMSSFLVKGTTSSDDRVATAVADGDSLNSSYQVEVERLASYSTWTKNPGWIEKNEVITETGGTFEYSYKGKYRTVNVPKGTTVEGLIKLINNDSKNPGVKAQIIQSVDGITFQLRGMDTGKDNTLVIRKVQDINGLNVAVDTMTSNYTDTENSATFNTEFSAADLNTRLNDSDEDKTFIYTVDGKRRSITVTNQDTIQTLVGKINAVETPDIASLKLQDNGNYKFVLQRDDTVYTATYDEEWSQTNSGVGPFEELVGNGTIPPKSFASPNSKILDDDAPDTTLQLTVRSNDGEQPHEQTYSFSVNQGTTLTDLVSQIKFQLGDRVDVKVVESTPNSGQYSLAINMVDKGHRLTVESGTLEELAYVPPTAPGWDVKHGENAKVSINGVSLEVASNTLKSSEVMPGITFTLHKIGESNISVYDDTEVMKENITAFVDAVNSFRTLLKAYTDYDEEKQAVAPEYSESLFDMQKGGLLQGNYGIQMVASRLKSCVADAATGFLPREYDAEGLLLGGDLFSSLAQIGITTNANEGESMYGLLEINYISNLMGSKTLDEALAEDPMAVAELFALQGQGRSNSDFLHFDSYVPGITKAGTHTVSYKISGDQIVEATINGLPAKIDNDNHTIMGLEGVGKGLVVNVANYDQDGEYSGSISIKEGKINDLLGLLEGAEGILGTNGTLRNLEKNYEGIIDGIEAKIQREDERLAKWEKNMLLKFSRLETVLSKYNQLQSDLESQLAQLKNGSS